MNLGENVDGLIHGFESRCSPAVARLSGAPERRLAHAHDQSHVVQHDGWRSAATRPAKPFPSEMGTLRSTSSSPCATRAVASSFQYRTAAMSVPKTAWMG